MSEQKASKQDANNSMFASQQQASSSELLERLKPAVATTCN
jgi:hypothetical protein